MDRDLSKLTPRVEEIRRLSGEDQGGIEWYQAASLAQTVLHDSVGGSHPLAETLRHALEKSDYTRSAAAARAVVRLFDEGGLFSPRLAIAHELEGDLLNVAQAQLRAGESTQDAPLRLMHLAIAAFLAGAALEDSLRRLCDAHNVEYDSQRSSLSKLQSVLYQPGKHIEIISSSENKQITVWGDTRNKADHGKFAEITLSEVTTMVVGVRAFVDRHLP